MANLKIAGAGVLMTFVAVFLEVIFIPMINTNLVALKDTTLGCFNISETAICSAELERNTTLLSTQKILFILPLFTVIGGLVASAGAGVMMGKK